MATTIQSLPIKSQEDHRDDYLRTWRNALIASGVPNPDASQGTEIYNRATALAQQIFAASNNTPVLADAQMPDSAQGDDLVRQARIHGLFLHPAGPSSGNIVFAASVSTAIAIATGQQLIDPSSNLYQVSVGGSYAGGASIPITALGVGAATNLAAGTTLRWLSGIPFVSPTAAVGLGGLTGGVDAETIEGLRTRFLEFLATPPNGVNWASVIDVGNASSSEVQYAFVYPACNGPSTEHVAVTRAPTATNKNRDVDALVLVGTIIPAILAEYPEFVEVVTTTVANSPTDVAFGLSLPAATTASPQGPGGGWVDGVPWPTYAPNGFADVTAFSSSTVFTVHCDALPSAGQSVCWLSTDDWILRTAQIVSVGSHTGTGPFAVAITIDTPFVSASPSPVAIAVGDYVFPSAENMATYVAAALSGFATMGPSEKTTSPTLLPRALRRPLATASWPSSLQNQFLREIEDAGEEVALAQYLARSQTTPALPSSITDPPNILVPQRLGFYPV